jgi:hypothetical protein
VAAAAPKAVRAAPLRRPPGGSTRWRARRRPAAQPHAGVAPAPAFDETVRGQWAQDLDQVMLGDIELLGWVTDGDRPVGLSREQRRFAQRIVGAGRQTPADPGPR